MSRLLKHSEPEQVEAGMAIHLALDELESVNLPFHLALAPGQREGRFDCILILGQAVGEAGKSGCSRGLKP